MRLAALEADVVNDDSLKNEEAPSLSRRETLSAPFEFEFVSQVLCLLLGEAEHVGDSEKSFMSCRVQLDVRKSDPPGPRWSSIHPSIL